MELLIDIFYNGVLALIVAFWILGIRAPRVGKLMTVLKKHRKVVATVLWIAFLALASSFVLYFDYFDDIHDIDEAVDAGAVATADGVNPYSVPVVPRFQEKYSDDLTWSNGTYNYLPLDLVVYTAAREVFGFLGTPVWFVVSNLAFSAVAFYLLRELVRVKWLSYVPFAGIVMLFYAFDNASLTMLLMVASMYAYSRFKTYPEVTAILLMTLAALTKAYAIFPLAVMVLFELQRALAERSLAKTSRVVVASVIGAAIGLAVILPFGLTEVLDSAVFFHASEDARAGTSYGGTLLAEIASESELFTYAAVAVMGLALVLSFLLRNMNDRVLLVIIAFLLVSVKSSQGTLTVAGLFLAIRLRELADARKAKAVKAQTDASPPSEASSQVPDQIT